MANEHQDKGAQLASLAITFGFVTLIIFICLFARYCNQTDERKAACVEKTGDAQGCDCLFGIGPCKEIPRSK